MRRISSLFIICAICAFLYPRNVTAKTQDTGTSTTFTAADLFADCKIANAYNQLPEYAQKDFGDKHMFEIGACLGYMLGWTQGVQGLIITKDGKPYVVHFKNVQIDTGIAVFVDYISQHRELVIKTADYALTQALMVADLIILTPWIPPVGPASLN